jgi:hypothetical protein
VISFHIGPSPCICIARGGMVLLLLDMKMIFRNRYFLLNLQGRDEGFRSSLVQLMVWVLRSAQLPLHPREHFATQDSALQTDFGRSTPQRDAGRTTCCNKPKLMLQLMQQCPAAHRSTPQPNFIRYSARRTLSISTLAWFIDSHLLMDDGTYDTNTDATTSMCARMRGVCAHTTCTFTQARKDAHAHTRAQTLWQVVRRPRTRVRRPYLQPNSIREECSGDGPAMGCGR